MGGGSACCTSMKTGLWIPRIHAEKSQVVTVATSITSEGVGGGVGKDNSLQ